MLFLLITCIAGCCFLATLFCLRGLRAGWWVHFIWFTGLAFLVEGSGYLLYFKYGISNHALFNLFLLVEYLFLSWAIHKLSKDYYRSGIPVIIGLTAVLAVYFYESISSSFRAYSANSFMAASIYFTLLCGLYYYFFMKQEQHVEIERFAPFWIITGLFLFYFGSTAIDFFFRYFAAHNAQNPKTLKLTRYKIFIVLNFILYASWAYAFICRQRQVTSAR